jgi:hypothetical protein
MTAGTPPCQFTAAKISGEIFLSSNLSSLNSSETEDIPKGLLRKIIREDLEMEIEDFIRAYEQYKGH